MIKMKITIIYDSKTGNTEKMAKAIAEGASKKADIEIKKIGEAFSLSAITYADAVIFGTPAIYANISNNMNDFLEHFEKFLKQNIMNINNKPAAVFGSYGYDGAWFMEEYMKGRVEKLGFKVYDEILVLVDDDLKYVFNEQSKKCEEFGKNFVDSIKNISTWGSN
jgi:flavorubredoxin